MEDANKGGESSNEKLSESVILKTVSSLVETVEQLLADAKNALKESPDDFIEDKICKLFGLVFAYKTCLERLNLKTKSEMEYLLKQYFRNHDIRELVCELDDVEREWDTFLQDVEKKLDDEAVDVVRVGEMGPVNVPVVDNEVSAADICVVVVTFGVRDGALQWLKDNKCDYPMLMDHHRTIYRAFGLERSVCKVWSVMGLVYYSEKLLEGVVLPKPYENIHEDPHQMGGDFIIDKEGKVRFMYCSQMTYDRPCIDVLHQEIKKI